MTNIPPAYNSKTAFKVLRGCTYIYHYSGTFEKPLVKNALN